MIIKTLSLGAGVQSSTIAEMIAEGQLPAVDLALFADTGDEPQAVYDQVAYLTDRLAAVGVPLVTVQQGNMLQDIWNGATFAALPAFTKQTSPIDSALFPGLDADTITIGRLRRQCTRQYKITPIEQYIRHWLLERELASLSADDRIFVKKGVTVEAWLGITTDGVARMKPSRVPWMVNKYPLVNLRMTRQDCLTWLQDRGLPIPPKSSCRVCPYHKDDYWRQMKETHPEDWQHVVTFDRALRDGSLNLKAADDGQMFLHRQCVPLDEVDLTPSGQLGLFDGDNGDMCDEGYCFI